MLTKQRKYNYIGELTLNKSKSLDRMNIYLPKDDIVNWLFLIVDKEGERRYTFFYKIEHPLEAIYEYPFNIQMSFIVDEIEKYIKINQIYDVWRGEEHVGKVKIVPMFENGNSS